MARTLGLIDDQLDSVDMSFIKGICTNFDNDLGKLLEALHKKHYKNTYGVYY